MGIAEFRCAKSLIFSGVRLKLKNLVRFFELD
jgi:hypothetical protein